MFKSGKLTPLFSLIVFLVLSAAVDAQDKSKKAKIYGKRVLWERVNIRQQNLLLGPGGNQMRPNLSRITFIEEEKGGGSKKYRIKDGAGRTWVAKIGIEAQSETAAVRLVSALGYKTEINYLVPRITIPGKGTFTNVRLEARPDYIERGDRWKWDENPFEGTNELQGLKIMMALLNNWDLKSSGNNKTLLVKKGSGYETQYIVSDLGATFGKVGNSKTGGPLSFILWRFNRSKNNASHYSKSKFIDEVEDGQIDFAYKGRNRYLLEDITIEQGRWLANLLLQLSNRQIEDAFRAANYSPAEVSILAQTVRRRIVDLGRVTNQLRAGS